MGAGLVRAVADSAVGYLRCHEKRLLAADRESPQRQQHESEPDCSDAGRASGDSRAGRVSQKSFCSKAKSAIILAHLIAELQRTMTVESMIGTAKEQGASDLHLESGLPPALRVRGSLRTFGDPLPAKLLLEAAQEVIGRDRWPQFVERRSYDLSRTIHGVRCRINVLQTSRGVGLAIRLLTSFQATIEKLNLHPDLKKLIQHTTGLILISGPTGSGKSSTLAALIQEINFAETRHIVTIESPIEYIFRPRSAYIRQREVGRDTP